MTLRMQAVLLRFLETGEIQRVGAERQSRHVDVRVITATNRDLRTRSPPGAFREDLTIVSMSSMSQCRRSASVERTSQSYSAISSKVTAVAHRSARAAS